MKIVGQAHFKNEIITVFYYFSNLLVLLEKNLIFYDEIDGSNKQCILLN